MVYHPSIQLSIFLSLTKSDNAIFIANPILNMLQVQYQMKYYFIKKEWTAYALSTFEHVFIIGMSCFSLFSYATAKNILQEILQKIILYCVKNGLL